MIDFDHRGRTEGRSYRSVSTLADRPPPWTILGSACNKQAPCRHSKECGPPDADAHDHPESMTKFMDRGPANSSSVVLSSNQPKFIVGWLAGIANASVPMQDQDPEFAKLIRILGVAIGHEFKDLLPIQDRVPGLRLLADFALNQRRWLFEKFDAKNLRFFGAKTPALVLATTRCPDPDNHVDACGAARSISWAVASGFNQ